MIVELKKTSEQNVSVEEFLGLREGFTENSDIFMIIKLNFDFEYF